MSSQPAGPTPAQELAELLEADIIFGRLRPHQELIEDALMARFDVKRHIVRSAIQELVFRQLVVKPRWKSARVKDFTRVEVDEIYQMRALLQRQAAHIMPMPVAQDELDELKSTYVSYVAAASVGADKVLIHRINIAFHERLFALCHNRTLCAAIAFYNEVSNPIRSYGIADKAWLARAIDEHAAMIRAIEMQDRETLERLVVDHMQPSRHLWESMRFHE